MGLLPTADCVLFVVIPILSLNLIHKAIIRGRRGSVYPIFML